jgi:hypothetical protein
MEVPKWLSNISGSCVEGFQIAYDVMREDLLGEPANKLQEDNQDVQNQSLSNDNSIWAESILSSNNTLDL